MRICLSIAAAAALFTTLTWSLAPAQTKFANQDENPVVVMRIRDHKGEPFAQIIVPGKGEIILGTNGWPASGAGYIEALPGKTYYVPFEWKGKFGGLHVQKIEWDRSGKTVSIAGLQPEFEGVEKNIKITSNREKPKILDGILYLQFEGKGKKEYKLRIVFGKGTAIDPPDL